MAQMKPAGATLESMPDQPVKLFDSIRMALDRPQLILSPTHGHVIKEISDLTGLPENWDSYGAAKIAEEATANATRFFTMLVTHLDQSVPLPIVGPSVEGGVVFRWELPELEVMVKILGRGGEFYVAKQNQDALLAEGEVGRFEALVSRLKGFFAERSQ